MGAFEVTDVPNGIVAYLNRNKNFDSFRKPYHYWITDICGCLRQSYYKLSGTPEDSNSDSTVEDLWSLQSRRYLHNLTYSYKWREFDIEKELLAKDIDEKLFIHGKLDMYDYKSQTIIDLKTTNAVKWQHGKGLIPRELDIDQIQCYSSLFNSKIPVSCLTLLYADMKNLIPFHIPLIDKREWIEKRTLQLHIALNIVRMPPPAETSSLCDYCKFKQRCELQDP